jgi:uncharacterized integral membrane protein
MTPEVQMRLIKIIIFFALLFYGVLFCVQNLQTTAVSIPFIAKLESVPLFMVILGCIIFGVFTGSLIGAARDVKHFFNKKSLRTENKQLKKKIDIIDTENRIQGQLNDE